MKIKEVRHLLTYDCNLRCRHCYLEAGETNKCRQPRDLSQKELDRFYHHFRPQSVSATGGEPLTRPEIVYRIAKSLAKYGGAMELVTNGFFLTKEIIEKLKTINPNIFFQISLDGTKKYHNKMRQHKDAYRHALEAIRLASDYGFITKARLTATSENLDQIPEIIKTLDNFKRKNIKLVIRPVVPRGRAKKNALGIDIEYLNLEKLKELPTYITVETTDNEGKCGCGVDTIAIDPVGNIYPCTYFVFKEKYKMGTIWDDPQRLKEHQEFVEYDGTCYARHVTT